MCSAPTDLKALIWDVDGTIAETERDGHRLAFNAAFEALGMPWRWSERRYGELLRVTGGVERLLHDMDVQPAAPTALQEREQLALRLHREKNARYVQIVATGGIALRGGVRELLDECTATGLPMAIATTTSRSNVDALLAAQLGARWEARFACVVCAEDAPRKKPDPLAYRMALQRLGLAAGGALAIEDSPAGVEACRAAGVSVVVTRSAYFADAPVSGALATGPGLHSAEGWQSPANRAASGVAGRIDLAQLRRWFAARFNAPPPATDWVRTVARHRPRRRRPA